MTDAEAQRTCPICGQRLADETETWCERCRRVYPWPLLKATMNNWNFYAKLRTGEVIRFAEASISGVWITLKQVELLNSAEFSVLEHEDPIMYGRGLVVQLGDIVWCADEDS